MTHTPIRTYDVDKAYLRVGADADRGRFVERDDYERAVEHRRRLFEALERLYVAAMSERDDAAFDDTRALLSELRPHVAKEGA